MGIDHSNPYIHSTTVLCDYFAENVPKSYACLISSILTKRGSVQQMLYITVDSRCLGSQIFEPFGVTI